jgi:hypothetical protein
MPVPDQFRNIVRRHFAMRKAKLYIKELVYIASEGICGYRKNNNTPGDYSLALGMRNLQSKDNMPEMRVYVSINTFKRSIAQK